MKKFATLQINDKIVNQYLFYRNLDINKRYSSSKKVIKKIDHYQWWFQKQKQRKSFFILKQKKPIFISTSDHFKFKNYQFIYSGLISCLSETNLFDLLKAIKIQNGYKDGEKYKKKRQIYFLNLTSDSPSRLTTQTNFNRKTRNQMDEFPK